MPLVRVRYRPGCLDKETLQSLASYIPTQVAGVLDCEEGKLSANDVDVCVSPYGEFDHFYHDLAIVVEANDYPSRGRDLEHRTELLSGLISDLLYIEGHPSTSFSVWVRLAHGAFAEHVME